MEKINNNKVLYFFVNFVCNAIVAMIIWPLLDMFFEIIIEKKEFIYSANKHIINPIIFGLFLAIFSTISKINSERKSKSSIK